MLVFQIRLPSGTLVGLCSVCCGGRQLRAQGPGHGEAGAELSGTSRVDSTSWRTKALGLKDKSPCCADWGSSSPALLGFLSSWR